VPQGYPNSELPPELMPPADMPPPPPWKHHPRNLLRGDQGISQELMDEMLRKEGHGSGGMGPTPMDPETRRLIEEAINGPREYNEWDTVPAKYPRLGEEETQPPLPPTVIPPDAPDWATTQQGMPEFMQYPTIRGKYTDT